MHTSWVETGAGAPFERYSLAAWQGPGACWSLDGNYGHLRDRRRWLSLRLSAIAIDNHAPAIAASKQRSERLRDLGESNDEGVDAANLSCA
ncbi:hypothetical protein ABIB48_000362 [Arthrobacter sp. UYCu511]